MLHSAERAVQVSQRASERMNHHRTLEYSRTGNPEPPTLQHVLFQKTVGNIFAADRHYRSGGRSMPVIAPRSTLRRWAVVPLRLIVGYGFVAHGYAKVVNGPERFAASLHALGVPAPHSMAWATIVIELVGGIAVLVGAWVPQFDQTSRRDRGMTAVRASRLRNEPPVPRCARDAGARRVGTVRGRRNISLPHGYSRRVRRTSCSDAEC